MTINDTIQEHSFITSFFCLVVFGSLSSRCLWFSFVSFFFLSSPSIRFFSVQRSDQTCCHVQRSDQKIPIRPLDVLAGPSPVLGRRGRRASTVDARPLASDRRRIQKPARHRSRSENENFAQTDATNLRSVASLPSPKLTDVTLFVRVPNPTSGHEKVPREFRCSIFF